MALLTEHGLDRNANSNNFLAGINDLQTNVTMKQYLQNHGILKDSQSSVFSDYAQLMSAPIWIRSLDD
jgi:hypothetical protein